MVIGSRTAKDDVRTFAEAAAHGEVVVNATGGIVSIDALTLAGADNLAGKPLLDISNALDHSQGFPPRVLAGDTDSNAERIQAAFPDARVVKTLNTMNANVMVHPRSLPGAHSTFLAGDDEDAKAVARGFLLEFGWTEDEVIDLGDLTAARGLELYLPLWLRLYGATGGHCSTSTSSAGEPGLAGARAGSRAGPRAGTGADPLGAGRRRDRARGSGRARQPAGVGAAGREGARVGRGPGVDGARGADRPWLLLGGWPLLATRLKGNGPVRDLALNLSWRSAAIGVRGRRRRAARRIAGRPAAGAAHAPAAGRPGRRRRARHRAASPVALALFALARRSAHRWSRSWRSAGSRTARCSSAT